MSAAKGGLVIFTANSNPSSRELGRRIAERLGVELGKVQVYQEANRETRVQIEEDVNTTIMELLIMVYACRTSCARNIIGVIPYFPYSKQCKMRKRGSIVSKLLASMMCKAGLTHLITMDLHQKEIQGFFNIPVDNLRASPFLLQYIQEEDAESDLVDGRHSPPTVKNIGAIHPSLEIPLLIPKEKPPITVVGDIQKLQCPKIKTVDISMILSEAIRRIHNGESMSYLFRNIGMDD
ncbi:Phosphoribosyl pyrophosphate synthase-associated protein 2 [Labeo rohita]|uniref:Phosphoribosyl pyrophosphate synthase-associated protein 2 n=1 Tax=Labeo rohita TaxID=84645 RepID=A0ABQ8MTG3_LABRO|nr:Phosphoribosyl pyrophosphate synthase-associated protein 2 [Labeo rohita]